MVRVCERDRYVVMCKVIIKNFIGIGVGEEDRKIIWFVDVEMSKKRGFIEMVRVIYEYFFIVFFNKKSVWFKVVFFEKSYGSKEFFDVLLCKVVINVF